MMNEYITKEEEKEYLAYHTYQDVLDNFESGLDFLRQFDFNKYKRKVTLICGAMVAFDKGLSNFLNKMYDNEKNCFLLSEVTAEYRRYTKDKIKMPYICTPHLLAKEILILGMDIPITDDMINLMQSKWYVKEAIDNMEGRHPSLGNGYAIVWAYYAYKYINELIKNLAPQRVILWNEFYAFHIIFRGVCKELKISVNYMEFGCIPGTICIERLGQQGESIPARYYIWFRSNKVSSKELCECEKVIRFLKESKLNRNLQPKVKINSNILIYHKSNRKTVSYLGQNDFESGIYPYTNQSKKFHSPIFKNSLDTLKYLSLVAIRNDWNLIYKPHPTMVALGHEMKDSEMIDVVCDVDINSVIDFSDLIVTILSQSAYIALIRNKPVLMLGYTQLKNKKCTYEAFDKKKIEKQIQKALKKGYTHKQKKAFQKHVAQLLKYYVYDDFTHDFFPFGKKINECRFI